MNPSRQPSLLKAADISLAYLLLRLVVGVSYFNHGFTRIHAIPAFTDSMVKAMAGAWMPEALVRVTAYFVPPVELVFALFLIAGLCIRLSQIVLFLLMQPWPTQDATTANVGCWASSHWGSLLSDHLLFPVQW